MRHNAMKLSLRHRRWLYATCVVLFASGAWWFALQHFATPSDGASTTQTWAMKIHGAAAMLSLLVIGTLIPIHIRRGWLARRNRTSGAVMIATTAMLILTGYVLYYAGGETLRSSASWIHSLLGLGAPVLLIWHIWHGRRSH